MRSQEKYDAANFDIVRLKIRKGWKQVLKEYAEEKGISMSRLFIDSIEAYTGLPVGNKKENRREDDV